MRSLKRSTRSLRSPRSRRGFCVDRPPRHSLGEREGILSMRLQLYDLAGADAARRFSPYCWRTRLALAHKGLPVETIPWRFTEKDTIARSGQGRVPVLVDGERWIADSWAIANYLQDTYPDRPSLFGPSTGQALPPSSSTLADTLGASIFRFVALDILPHLPYKYRHYFRNS